MPIEQEDFSYISNVNKNNVLFDSIYVNSISIVKYILKKFNVNINGYFQDNMTFLALAAVNNYRYTMVESRRPPVLRNPRQETPETRQNRENNEKERRIQNQQNIYNNYLIIALLIVKGANRDITGLTGISANTMIGDTNNNELREYMDELYNRNFAISYGLSNNLESEDIINVIHKYLNNPIGTYGMPCIEHNKCLSNCCNIHGRCDKIEICQGNTGGRKIRKHKGIIQNGGNKGKLRKGYKYTGKRTKTGLPIIKKV